MDVLDHLIEEHREAELLMQALTESEAGPERERLLGELEEALATHMAVEEQFVYPLVADALGKEDVQEGENEHDLAREGLAKMREMLSEPGFGAALDMVKAGIGHHVEEEEQDMFPELREKAADRVAALGTPEELEAKVKTKAELYEKATEAGIEGRSTMSKDELAEAVAKS